LQVAELSFTPAQRRLLVALRKLYLRNLGVLSRRRQHLALELQVRCHAPIAAFKDPPDMCLFGLVWDRKQRASAMSARVPAAYHACVRSYMVPSRLSDCADGHTQVFGALQVACRLMLFLARQEALAMPLCEQQAQVAVAHRRTAAVMARLRATMRDEHSFLVQVRATYSANWSRFDLMSVVSLLTTWQ